MQYPDSARAVVRPVVSLKRPSKNEKARRSIKQWSVALASARDR